MLEFCYNFSIKCYIKYLDNIETNVFGDKIFALFSLFRRVLARLGFVWVTVHSSTWWWTVVAQESWVLVGGGTVVCRDTGGGATTLFVYIQGVFFVRNYVN